MVHNLQFALQSAWRVLLVGLLLGAGLPTLFALGVRSLAWGAGGDASQTVASRGNPAGRPLGWLCFAVVLLGVVLGITFIVASGFGKALSFEHIYPTVIDKKK